MKQTIILCKKPCLLHCVVDFMQAGVGICISREIQFIIAVRVILHTSFKAVLSQYFTNYD